MSKFFVMHFLLCLSVLHNYFDGPAKDIYFRSN